VNNNTVLFAVVILLTLLLSRTRSNVWQRRAAFGALALVLLFAPSLSDNVAVLTPVLIAVLLGAGWNIIGGFSGYASFGQVAFFGLGAYAMAASIGKTEGFLGLPAAAGFLIAILVCGAFAFLVGLPVLRLRGHYFAITTLALGFATQQVVKSLDFLGGSSGISTPIIREIHGLNRDDYFYYLGLAFVALATIVTWLVSRSKFGFGLLAIRENEDAAASMGVDTTRYKILAFVLAAMITAVAGALQAYLRSGVSPENDGVFQLRFNLLPLIVALIGGTGTVWGPLIGAFTFLGIEHVLISFSGSSSLVQDWERVITGAIIVLVVIFLPRGLSQFVGGRGVRGWQALRQSLRVYRV
jgi:branched-chain amino acid transport system permease protein